MRRLAAVLAVLGVCAVPAVAFAVDDLPLGRIPDTSVWQTGTTTEMQQGRTMQCDVMRDYYYDHDSGEFLGWASDPYVANCVEVSTPGGNCKPGVLPCCPAGENCPPEEPDPVPPHDNPPPPTPPRKTCAQCKEEQKRNLDRIANQIRSCTTNWGMQAADAMCRHGLVRGGSGYDPNLDFVINHILHGSPHYCMDSPVGPSCATLPEYTQCVNRYMYGYPQTTINTPGDSQTGNIGLGAAAEPWAVEGNYEYTHTAPGQEVQLPAGEGYANMCTDSFRSQLNGTMAAYNRCQKNSRDGQGSNGQRSCPAPGQGGGVNRPTRH